MDNRITLNYPLQRVERQADLHVREPDLSDQFDSFMQVAESVQCSDDVSAALPSNSPVSNNSMGQLGGPPPVSGATYLMAGEIRVTQALQIATLLNKRIQGVTTNSNKAMRVEVVDDPSGVVDIELSRNKDHQWSITIGLQNTTNVDSLNDQISPGTLTTLQNEIVKALTESGVQLEALLIEQRAAPFREGDA